MAGLSKRDLAKLEECDVAIRRIVYNVAQKLPIRVICGFRNEAQQNALYPKYTQVQWPMSKHNKQPSQAVDLAPDPIDWEATDKFEAIALEMYAEAQRQDVAIRWGGAWKMRDLGHFELKETTLN